jgi:hypothetical protein
MRLISNYDRFDKRDSYTAQCRIEQEGGKIGHAWYEESESLDNATRSGKREECMRTVVPYSQRSSKRPFRQQSNIHECSIVRTEQTAFFASDLLEIDDLNSAANRQSYKSPLMNNAKRKIKSIKD